MIIIYVDTSAIYAALTSTDPVHAIAVSRFNAFFNDREVHLVTSNYVVVETATLLSRRFGVQAVKSLVSNILPNISVWWVDEAIHQAGLNALLMAGKNGPSLVDCTSFAMMRVHGITHAFAFDSHFTEQGFHL